MEQHTFQSEQIDAIVKALVQFSKGFQAANLKKDSQNKHLKNQYVSFDNILHTCRPILSECGLFVSQALSGEYLTTTIFHESGQYIGARMPFLAMKGNNGTNPLQDLGGGITYAKRYQFSAMLNISTDVDDDAQSATKVVTQPKQAAQKKAVNDAQFNSLVIWIQDCPEAEKQSRVQKALESYELNQTQSDTINSL